MQTESSPSVKVFYPAFELEDLIGRLRSGLKQLSAMLPLRQSVLFGSWAQGKQTAFSDIDLLVIYSGPRRDEAYKLVRRTLGIKGLEPHTYTVEEAGRMKDVVTKMMEDGIVVWEGSRS